MARKSIAVVASAPLVVHLLLEPIIFRLMENYSVTVMTNASGDDRDLLDFLPNDVLIVDTKMQREINILSDLKTLFFLFRSLSNKKIDLIYTVSPKAGLLGILAAKVAGVPIRIHNFTGQVWQTKAGLPRFFLKFLDKMIYRCSTQVLADSKSQRDFLIDENVIKKNRINVLGAGSLIGVDLKRFTPDQNLRARIRDQLHVSADDIVFLFLGRLGFEKGISDLLHAYSELTEKVSNTSLWLVGPAETDIEHLGFTPDLVGRNSIRFIGYTESPESYMAAADVFCLPSYREGFGTVIIEAAACGLPSIGSKISGLVDAISNNETGILVNIQDADSLRDAMHLLASDEALRLKLGKAARERAHRLFDQSAVVARLIAFFEAQLEQRGFHGN